jgi:predicted Zn-dependent protease
MAGKKRLTLFFSILLLFGCVENPLTGKKTMAFISDAQLFSMADEQYREFLGENTVINPDKDTRAAMVRRVGQKIATAAQKWCESEGKPKYLRNYKWEYNLVDDKTVNAWCMPGGKIVVYTGILQYTSNEDGLAVVMGHEVAHALLNHGQQRMSAGLLQQLGAGILGAFTDSQLIMGLYGVTTNLAAMLPFSREHESESDHYGLILMAIAGYNPEEGPLFWQRMPGGTSIEFLSTHPSHSTRIDDLRGWVGEAKQKAAQINGK